MLQGETQYDVLRANEMTQQPTIGMNLYIVDDTKRLFYLYDVSSDPNYEFLYQEYIMCTNIVLIVAQHPEELNAWSIKIRKDRPLVPILRVVLTHDEPENKEPEHSAVVDLAINTADPTDRIRVLRALDAIPFSPRRIVDIAPIHPAYTPQTCCITCLAWCVALMWSCCCSRSSTTQHN